MLTIPDTRIGDAWYYAANDLIHCFFLYADSAVPRNSSWNIGHAISRDLVKWKISRPAIEAAPSDPCLGAGSVVGWNNRYWMAYSMGHGGPDPATGVAVSDDLYTWDRVPWNPTTKIDERYYARTGTGVRSMAHWRHPFLFAYDNAVYQVVCANKNDGPADARGTLGLSRSFDMINWQALPPVELPEICQELENPTIHCHNDVWYCVFSSKPEWFCRDLQDTHGAELRPGAYCMTAPTPCGPYTMYDTGLVIPNYAGPQPYACQLISWKSQWYLLGTYDDDGKGYIGTPLPVEPGPTGALVRF